jgi:hypothetical protein
MHNVSSNRTNTLLALTLVAILPLASSAAFAETKPQVHMYRYTNSKGTVVTSNSIAPEFARKGYQIVTIGGDVLQTVPPEPTAEDRAKAAQDAKDKLSVAQQAEEDKQLLLRYSTMDEIQFAKQRKLAEINNKIVLLNSNVSTLESQIDAEQQRAATYERNGQPVPSILLKKIDDLKKELKATNDQVASRKQELADETVRFDKETARLTILNKNRPKN